MHLTDRIMKLRSAALLLSIATGCQIFGQAPTWDSTGNAMFTTSTYYFREVTWTNTSGGLTDAQVVFGTMTFSANSSGTYAMAANYIDGASGQPETGNLTGTYAMGAGGFGYISDPLQSSVQIRGTFANGVFIGSATESTGFNNLFIAGQIPASAPTAGTFSGTYTMAYMNFNQSNPEYFEDSSFTLTANGAGSASQSSMLGYYSGNGSTQTGQGSTNLKYTVSNGAVVLNFPTSSAATLVSGQEYLYFSPDGNFVFGGSPNGFGVNSDGFDFLIGVKNTGSNTLNNGLWYNAGVYQDATGNACEADDMVSYYGSFDVSSAIAIKHQRLFSSVCSGTYSDVSTDTNPSSDPTVTYTVGDGGNIRIGVGIPPYLGIDIAMAAPTFSGSGVYINPTGVLNSGSYAPFTSGVSPGEIITIFGTGLATGNGSAQSTTLPTQILGTEVLIDGLPAPVYYVSPTQVSAIVPYDASTFSVASIAVKNNGVLSNVVSEPVDNNTTNSATTPGVFTYPVPNGISYAAAQHLDYTDVTVDSPAQPGETIVVYLTGLGAVFPTIADGVPGNGNFTVATIDVDISGVPATVLYSGLSGFAGLYQLNVTIPSTGLTAGPNFFDIAGPASYSSEALIPIGSGSSLARPATADAKGAQVQNGQPQKSGKHWHPRPSQNPEIQKAKQP
jgi:uncharacterized protein (TIGR03437 family)